MGQGYSGQWQNQTAQAYLPFLVNLFGNPYIYVNKPQGFAIWNKANFQGKTLFQLPVCFEKILVRDENIPHNDTSPPHFDFLYIYVKIPMSISQQQSLIQLSDNVGYDRFKQILWARCDSLDSVLVLLKLASDVAVGQNSVLSILDNGQVGKLMSAIQTNNPQTNNININAVKALYVSLYNNVTGNSGNSEHFSDHPWYADNGSYTSNQPLHVILGEQNDAEYYRTIDNYMKSKNVSRSPDAYPRAPTGKPTLDNFYDTPQKKKREQLTNKRTRKISGKTNGKVIKRAEHLIPFNAYSQYNKNQGQENLIPFNAYTKYVKESMSNLGEMTGFIKKKNI